MATSYVLYLPEKLPAPAQYLRTLGQTAIQAPIVANTNGLRAALHDPTNVVPDVPTEEALCLEIEKLCIATLIIDQAFYDIGRRLSSASKEQKKRGDLYDICHTLETQWNEHHRTYQNLLWRSREFAGEAQGAVDDFRHLVLPSLRDQDVTSSEKQEIIRGQLELLREIAQPSQNLSQEFLDFNRTLDTYIAEFAQVVEGLRIDGQSQTVSGLEDRLRGARAAMEVVSREVKELGWKFATDIAVTGIEFLLAFVAPSWWEKLAGAAVIAIDCVRVKHPGPALFEARKRCNVAVAEYEAIKAEYDLESACLGQMVKLESTLNDSRPLVQDVTIRLGIFATVWAAITADIRQLKSLLHHAEDLKSPLFIPRVRKLERMYGYLSRALRHYQVTIWAPMPGTFVPL